MSEYLQKIVYLTDSQYATLAGGGTVGSLTGLNDNYIYITDGKVSLSDFDDSFILPVNKGGTGASSWASGKILVGNGSSTFSTIDKATAATGSTLVERTSNGSINAVAVTGTGLLTMGTLDGGQHIINGNLQLNAQSGSYNEGLRINRSTTGYANIYLGGSRSSASSNQTGGWWIGTLSTPADATSTGDSITNTVFTISNNSTADTLSIKGTRGATIGTNSGWAIKPRLAVGTTYQTGYTLYVNGTSYLNGNVSLAGSITVSKASECGMEVVNSQATNPHSGAFIVGNSGNLGIYDRTNSKWIVYSTPSGNVYLNGNATSATAISTNGTTGQFWRGDNSWSNEINGPVIHTTSSTGLAEITSALDAIIISPSKTRTSTTNTYYPGLAFNHMWTHSNSYKKNAQGWIGLRLHSTPGSELSYLVLATKPGTGTTDTGNDRPIERMCIAPDGTIGINTLSPTYKLHINGDIKGNSRVNVTLTGTGTAASDAGSGDNRYKPATWKFNLNIATPNDGDTITVVAPVASHDYGVLVSTDNGTTYYPVSVSGATRLTGQYSANSIIMLTFDADGTTNSVFPLAGSTSRQNFTGGCWRVVNYYDSGNPGDWNVRQYTLKAQTAVTAGHIIGGTDNGYNHVDNGTAFDIRYAVLYASSDISASSTGSGNYIHHYAINIKNSSNSWISGWTAYKNLYIKGTISGNTFTPISGGSPYVQDITTSDDNYVYYYIGRTYSSNAITFDTTAKAIYWYKNGAIRPYTGSYTANADGSVVSISRNTETTIATINGKTLKIKIPASDNTWRPIGTGADDAMAGNTTVTNVAISANVTTNANYPVVFATSNKDTTAAKNEGLQKSGAKFYFNPNSGILTATGFAGALTGNVTGDCSGSSGSCTGNAASATKVAAKLAATTKTYLLGTSTTITGTAANVDLIGDTGIYATTTAGELSAVRHSFNVSGTEKAYITYNSTDNSLDFVFV